MSRKLLLLVFVLALAAGLCGCVRRAAYQRPAPPVPAAWPHGAAAAPAPAVPPWQEFFTGRGLQGVIGLALANNRDLRIAALNVEKAQALYRIQRAQQFPTVAASASGNAYRLPGSMTKSGDAEIVGQFIAGAGFTSWELDLFGRIRSLKSAALERYLATEQARNAARIALVGAVADTYLALAADRENLRLAKETLAAQQASYELIRRTREAGLASDLTLRQAETQVEVARADIARYSGRIELDENALTLLVGAPVPAALLPATLAPDSAFPELAAGIPSDVLLRRPDILAAEHQLQAAHANIGAARANFFPRISLTAGLGLMSGDLAELFKPGSGTWNFAPQAVLPIFDSGARKAAVKVAEADRDAAVAAYEQAVQSAFREVSDALALRARLAEQQTAQQNLLRALEETYRLSDARYKGGIDSYLSVLVAQRSLYGAQQALINLRLARLSNLVTLYKALGGGL